MNFIICICNVTRNLSFWSVFKSIFTFHFKTELIYIFGVQDADNTVLSDDEIRGVIRMEYSPSLVSMVRRAEPVPDHATRARAIAACPAAVGSGFSISNHA